MATALWRTCRERDGMRPAKFRPKASYVISDIFQHGGRQQF